MSIINLGPGKLLVAQNELKRDLSAYKQSVQPPALIIEDVRSFPSSTVGESDLVTAITEQSLSQP